MSVRVNHEQKKKRGHGGETPGVFRRAVKIMDTDDKANEPVSAAAAFAPFSSASVSEVSAWELFSESPFAAPTQSQARITYYNYYKFNVIYM